MLEFVVVYLLAKKNGEIVRDKGQSPTANQWGTAGLWFGGELCGAFIGRLILGPLDGFFAYYPFALAGAIVGAVMAYAWAKSVPENRMLLWRPEYRTPPSGMPAWAYPNASVPPSLMIPGNVALMYESGSGDWALVRSGNGWRGFVGARALVPITYALVRNQDPVHVGPIESQFNGQSNFTCPFCGYARLGDRDAVALHMQQDHPSTDSTNQAPLAWT
jgi:hypothetical protein